MEFLTEFLKFLIARKKWWLMPLIIIAFVLGSLLFLSQGSVLAPFIYTIF